MLAWYTCQELGIISQTYPEPLLQLRKVVGRIEATEATEGSFIDKFSDVFDTSVQLKPMTGDPMRIELKHGYTPRRLTVPRAVPFAGERLSNPSSMTWCPRE